MSHNITTRVDRLEWRWPTNGAAHASAPTHSFDFETFERLFREMAETDPNFPDRWLQERDLHDHP